LSTSWNTRSAACSRATSSARLDTVALAATHIPTVSAPLRAIALHDAFRTLPPVLLLDTDTEAWKHPSRWMRASRSTPLHSQCPENHGNPARAIARRHGSVLDPKAWRPGC